MPQFAAFLSYARLDDEYEDGAVSGFRARLEAAVRQYTGQREFQIYQDTRDIRWGQQWKEALEQALEDVFLLFPIMTPLYFNSEGCRQEYELFLERERQLGRNDLILPVYWLNCDEMENRERREANPFAKGLAGHQRMDWRSLRRVPLNAQEVLQAIDAMALQVKQTLQAGPTVPLPIPFPGPTAVAPSERRGATGPGEGTEVSPTTEAAQSAEPSMVASLAVAPTEPPTRTVDAMGRGDYISLVDAVVESNPGDRLMVRPGFYPGGLVLDKPLEIIGVGNRDEVVVQATGSSVILFKANMGFVRNLTLRQIGGGDWYGIDVTQGRLVLEDCDISSQSRACVAVHDGADPVVRRNRIHDGKQSGILVKDNGRGTFEENEVFGNAFAGIAVREGADPVVRRNRIHDGKQGGIFVYGNGRGTFEENEVFGNALTGIEVREGGDPVVRRNRIHDEKSAGILVRGNGRGTFEENEVFGNALSGILVKDGGDPVVRRNRIHDDKQDGILVYENGRGTFEENEVFGNAYAGIEVREGSDPVVRRNRITGNGFAAVRVHDKGAGTFEDNDLRGNPRGSWDIAAGCTVKRARNQEDAPSKT